MKVLRGILIAIGLTLLSLLMALFDVAYDADYYHSFQQEQDIAKRTSLSQDSLHVVNRDIITYLKTGEPSLMRDHFGEREVAHMKDVYGLFSTARVVALLSAVTVALLFFEEFRTRRREVCFATLVTQGLLFLLIALIGVYAALHWNSAFTVFHQLFFDNSLWILDPATDLMIQMMPTPFFVGMAIRIGRKAALFLALFYAIFLLIRYGEFGREDAEKL